MDHLLSQPDAWFAHHAVFDHDTGGLLAEIEQPFLACMWPTISTPRPPARFAATASG